MGTNFNDGWVRSLGPPGMDIVVSVRRGFRRSILGLEIRFNPKKFGIMLYTHEMYEDLRISIDYGHRGYPELVSDLDGLQRGQLSIAMNTDQEKYAAEVVDTIVNWFNQLA